MQNVKGGERQEMERRQLSQGLQQQSIREDREVLWIQPRMMPTLDGRDVCHD